MVNVKQIAKPKKNASGTGTSSGGVTTVSTVADEAKHASQADKATFADQAQYAVKAGAADRAGYADTAGDIADGSPVYDKFLRKDVADTAKGHITMEDGVSVKNGADITGDTTISGKASITGDTAIKGDTTFGEFNSGLVGGTGARITSSGAGEMQSLAIREFLEVPELRYNRVSIQVGNRWRAAGAGIIESVTKESDTTGIITLHLEDGEMGKIALDDICQGIWHEGMTTSDNDSEDYDDGIGNFKFAGFYTCYFRITEILETGTNSRFRYMLRPVSDTWSNQHHPHEAMHFVCYGNFSDTTRQSSRYSTLTYERYLRDVNNWEFTSSMIAAQFGDLSNLSVFGLKMTGYSAYLNNIYMSGAIKQFEDKARKMVIDQSLSGYMAVGETETVTVQVVDGYMGDHTSEYTFKVERDTGDTAADAVWNAEAKHLNCGAEFEISFDDLHISDYHSGVSTLFYVTATDGKETIATAMKY